MIRLSYHQLFIVDDAKETSNTIKKLRDKTIRRGGMMTNTTTTKTNETTNDDNDENDNQAKAGGSNVTPHALPISRG